MKRKIYITNLPSFYKVNLLNELNKYLNLEVVFTDDQSSIRNSDFFKGTRRFKYHSFHSIGLFKKIIKVKGLLDKQFYDEVILCGWDQILFWVIAFTNTKYKNALVIESSIYESQTKGVKGLIKRVFLSRISKVYCSGKAQVAILKELNYNGQIVITKGVGVFNIVTQPPFRAEEQKVDDFVYVGRFSQEKNLLFLIEFFNKNPHLKLHLIGFGPLEEIMKKKSSSNIVFHGAVANEKLYVILQQFHVLVLPSISEPWGLVVEEALNNGLPVIISNRVGCLDEVVTEDVGLSFTFDDDNSFSFAVEKITNLNFYNNLRYNVSKLDFDVITHEQVNSYL
jgi:glycosyltransferase involved in cell wall biosynthesis